MSGSRADATRSAWLAALDKFRFDPERPAGELIWSPRLDSPSRDQLMAIQTEKLRAAVPFLYENSAFYRRRFDRLGLLPSDIRSLDDLAKWPVVDKSEMMTDAVHDALDRLRGAAAAHSVSCGGLALAWVIAHPDCTAPIVGPSRAAPHLDHLAEALDLVLAPEEHAQIASWFEAAGHDGRSR